MASTHSPPRSTASDIKMHGGWGGMGGVHLPHVSTIPKMNVFAPAFWAIVVYYSKEGAIFASKWQIWINYGTNGPFRTF